MFTIKHVIRATNPDKKNSKHAHKIPLKPIENGIAIDTREKKGYPNS